MGPVLHGASEPGGAAEQLHEAACRVRAGQGAAGHGDRVQWDAAGHEELQSGRVSAVQ